MRRFVDLHTHSIASDGSLPPAEVVRRAEGHRLAAVALTDHDTVEGLAEARAAAAEFPRLIFVPGIEVSAMFTGGTLHILGLGINENSPAVAAMCANLRTARQERNPRIIAKLQSMGIGIDMEDVLRTIASIGGGKQAGGTKQDRIVGRLHIAETMRRKGYVSDVAQAFDRYIGNEGPAYVDKERLAPAEAITAIRQGGGVAVLAHPPQLHYQNNAQLERIIRSLIHDGLEGIEVYHSDSTDEQTRQYLNLAKKFDLAVTGGSDFHGPAKPHVMIGRPRVPLAAISSHWATKLFGRPAASI